MSKRLPKRRTATAKRVKEALDILTALDVPREQQNERSALTLLALLGMTPRTAWRVAKAPMLGITEMMSVFRDQFGKAYAPNTRETVRRFTVHQFVQIGLVMANPDDPRRPVNSPDNRYQVTPPFLKLARTYGSTAWKTSLSAFLATADTLGRLQRKERKMALLPVKLPSGKKVSLTAGGQNELVKKIVEEFCPRFTPGGVIAFLGDTGQKHRHVEAGYLKRLGVEIDEHGKMPDVVVHLNKKDWLVLIEAVTSHGPIGLKRHNELKALFGSARAGLVFVTAFLTRRAMTKYLGDIAWETEVWIAESPSHIIHFNGERFLGPYE
ncbi:MAG: BsuBI/PstI family type II restriction endonuclease [Candidatus Aminicenantes bacterium]|nr:BsuBI/PstI family type II restriction endonuclease [Candidatus Aminicenantes bacterium]